MSVTGGPRPSTVPFKNLNSFLFDGVDDKMFSTANYTELNGTQNFSISFWIKPIDTSNGVVWRLGSQVGTNRLACLHNVSNESLDISFNTSSYYFRTTAGSVPLNQWTHIVYTYDGTQTRYNRPNVHINGVDNIGTTAGVIVTSSTFDGTLELGGTGTSGAVNFGNNYIDEFAVWNNTTLTVAQSNELFNSGTPTDLNNIASGLAQPTTWFRMGDLSTWNGTSWIMRDVNGRYVNRSINMVEANRTTDVPPNPFANTKSILLDGVDDFVSVYNGVLGSAPIEFTATDDFSFSAWIKTSSTATQNQILSFRGTALIWFYTSGSNRRLTLFMRDDTGNTVAVSSYNNSSGYVASNTWTNVILTRNGTTKTINMYLNGVSAQVPQTDTTSNDFTLFDKISIGNDNHLGGRYNFDGNIDEISVFNSELSQSDITSIYNGGEPNDISSLSPLSWWRCGDGDTSPTLTDNGSGGNDGTMTNFSTFSTDVPTIPFSTKSIALDGVDDYVDCGTGLGNSEGTITNFSVSMWIKPSVTSGNDLFFNVGNFANSFGEIAFQLQSNNLYIKLDGSAYIVSVPYTNTTAWQHLVFVYDGGNSANTKMYINGALQSPNTGGVHPSSLNLSGLKTIIGAGYSVSYPYAGLQDEVSYFNTTLSASDVTTIYNGGVPNDISSLSPLSWWRCGDGDTAPTLTDNGSASNDGTMTNFTTFSTDVPR